MIDYRSILIRVLFDKGFPRTLGQKVVLDI